MGGGGNYKREGTGGQKNVRYIERGCCLRTWDTRAALDKLWQQWLCCAVLCESLSVSVSD